MSGLSAKPDFRISVAPMVDWTDTWFRRFARLLTKRAYLYTEMITAPAIIHGDPERILGFDSCENPLVLQIASDSPREAARAVRLAESRPYAEINLNIGCPSDKVQKARFGACLMAEPELVRDILIAMKDATAKPVTVKHRIGIDSLGAYEDLHSFVGIVSEAGPARLIVHSRIAILDGLDPKENRTVPPLRHEDVHRLKRDFPNCVIEINGGIRDIRGIRDHAAVMDGVMIGREAYENPVSMAAYDRVLGYKDSDRIETYRQLLNEIGSLDTSLRDRGIPPWRLYRHLSGLIRNMRGAKEWRRFLNAKALKDPDTAPGIADIMELLPCETLESPLCPD